MTKKFCCIFKKESPETYFIPPKTTGKNQTIARGKFVDKYRNWRTAQKELGLVHSKKSVNNHDSENEENSVNEVNSDCKIHFNHHYRIKVKYAFFIIHNNFIFQLTNTFFGF